MGQDSKTLKRQRRRIVALETERRKLKFQNLMLQHKLEKYEPKKDLPTASEYLATAVENQDSVGYDLPGYDPKADEGAIDEVVNA